MPKATPNKIQSAGRRNFYADEETAKNLTFILKYGDKYSISSAIKEGLKMVKRRIAKKTGMQLTETSN